MLHVNEDGVADLVLGFGTGADGYNIPAFVCDIYFAGQQPCLGGVLALDGRDGRELWRLWTEHEIFSLTCQVSSIAFTLISSSSPRHDDPRLTWMETT